MQIECSDDQEDLKKIILLPGSGVQFNRNLPCYRTFKLFCRPICSFIDVVNLQIMFKESLITVVEAEWKSSLVRREGII